MHGAVMARKNFNLTITTALATALLGGCAQDPSEPDWDDNGNAYARRDVAVCVDQQGQRIDDDHCSDDRRHHSGGSFIYLGRGGYIPYHGERARPGTYSTVPRAGATYSPAHNSTNMTRSAAVARGGFGSSARSSGSYFSGGS
jgi:hypothetical protein